MIGLGLGNHLGAGQPDQLELKPFQRGNMYLFRRTTFLSLVLTFVLMATFAMGQAPGKAPGAGAEQGLQGRQNQQGQQRQPGQQRRADLAPGIMGLLPHGVATGRFAQQMRLKAEQQNLLDEFLKAMQEQQEHYLALRRGVRHPFASQLMNGSFKPDELLQAYKNMQVQREDVLKEVYLKFEAFYQSLDAQQKEDLANWIRRMQERNH